MSIERWEGTCTATSSVAHTGEALGTISYLRRERTLLPDGTIEDIPVVSGNALRGLLRDVGADLTWDALGRPALPASVVHTLWAGGALTKARGDALTGARLADLRRTFAHLNVFGASGAGRIIDGLLAVGKMLPICAQTAHLIPQEHHGPTLPDIWDLLQIEYHSMVPHHTGEDPAPTPMRYGTETFIAGTRFYAWLTLTHPSPSATQFLTDVLDTYAAHAHVGGGHARGHGTLTVNLTRTGTTPLAPWNDFNGHTPAEAAAMLKVFT